MYIVGAVYGTYGETVVANMHSTGVVKKKCLKIGGQSVPPRETKHICM